jgi:heme/copper-type cytochrome/quinol oxidase subunit 4
MNESFDLVTRFLPVLIPIALIQLGMMIAALVHLLKRKAVKRGSVALWAVIIVLVNIVGPVLYFLIGREES